MCKPITEVFRQGLWMRHYGSESCKHTFLWSNSSGVRHLYLGRLTKDRVAIMVYDDPNISQFHFYGIQVVCPKPIPPSHRAFGQEQRQSAVPLATKNVDRNGKRRATGVKKRLKKSQNLFNDLAVIAGIIRKLLLYLYDLIIRTLK